MRFQSVFCSPFWGFRFLLEVFYFPAAVFPRCIFHWEGLGSNPVFLTVFLIFKFGDLGLNWVVQVRSCCSASCWVGCLVGGSAVRVGSFFGLNFGFDGCLARYSAEQCWSVCLDRCFQELGFDRGFDWFSQVDAGLNQWIGSGAMGLLLKCSCFKVLNSPASSWTTCFDHPWFCASTRWNDCGGGTNHCGVFWPFHWTANAPFKYRYLINKSSN